MIKLPGESDHSADEGDEEGEPAKLTVSFQENVDEELGDRTPRNDEDQTKTRRKFLLLMTALVSCVLMLGLGFAVSKVFHGKATGNSMTVYAKAPTPFLAPYTSILA